MNFQFNVSHRIQIENMIVEVRDYKIDRDEEFVMETSRLRMTSALDLNASKLNPVAVWQLPNSKEWVPQRQISVFPPQVPVRVRIPKGEHKTLGFVIDQKKIHRWSPIALASALGVVDEQIHHISTLLSRELEGDGEDKPQMIAGLSKLFTRRVGRQLRKPHVTESNALIAWRMRKIMEAIDQAALGEDLNLDKLAAKCRMSRQYLLSQFRQATGVSLGNHLWSARADHAKRLIEEKHSFSSIAKKLNYSGLSHFSSRFSRSTGISPSKYRQQVRLQD